VTEPEVLQLCVTDEHKSRVRSRDHG
jgi:hypothetical protein